MPPQWICKNTKNMCKSRYRIRKTMKFRTRLITSHFRSHTVRNLKIISRLTTSRFRSHPIRHFKIISRLTTNQFRSHTTKNFKVISRLTTSQLRSHTIRNFMQIRSKLLLVTQLMRKLSKTLRYKVPVAIKWTVIRKIIVKTMERIKIAFMIQLMFKVSISRRNQRTISISTRRHRSYEFVIPIEYDE